MSKININLSRDTIMNCLLGILVITILSISYFNSFSQFSQPNFTTHIIITRYKEPDISELVQPFINKENISIFIYNKGDDTPTGIPENAKNITIINIPNLGWDSYGYINHIIQNYNNLPDYVVNIHASAKYLSHKFSLFNDIITILDTIKENNTKYYGGRVELTSLYFRLEDWNATLDINKQTNNKYSKSSIYPLNNWIKSKIKTISDNVIQEDALKCNYYGQFIVHKSRILKYPISFYTEILSEISVWQSEVNHYLERSWYTFYNDD